MKAFFEIVVATAKALVAPFLLIAVLGFLIGIGAGLFSIDYQLAGAITNLLK